MTDSLRFALKNYDRQVEKLFTEMALCAMRSDWESRQDIQRYIHNVIMSFEYLIIQADCFTSFAYNVR